tara:strand:+ start:387 stop:536 length:150 start_codon:yes stop_codon:yes gene_type:complete
MGFVILSRIKSLICNKLILSKISKKIIRKTKPFNIEEKSNKFFLKLLDR